MLFFVTGGLLLVAFAASILFVREQFTPAKEATSLSCEVWKLIPNPQVVVAMFVTTFMLQLANMSIQPIVTVYVEQSTLPFRAYRLDCRRCDGLRWIRERTFGALTRPVVWQGPPESGC